MHEDQDTSADTARTLHQSQADFRRSYLQALDVPCPGCGYNLRGLGGDACPECNQQIEMGIRLVEPRLAPYIAAVVGLTFFTGGAGTCFLLLMIGTILFGSGPPASMYGWTGIPAAAGTVGLAVLTLKRTRVWFRGTTNRTRRWIILLCWMCAIGYVAALTGIMILES